MINGNEMKNNIKYELENLDDITLTITGSNILIECASLDLFYDEIQENTTEANKLLNWETSNRKYIVENNYFKIIVPLPITSNLRNITSTVKEAIYETYLDMCMFSRNTGIYQEATGGILL